MIDFIYKVLNVLNVEWDAVNVKEMRILVSNVWMDTIWREILVYNVNLPVLNAYQLPFVYSVGLEKKIDSALPPVSVYMDIEI